MPGTTATAAPGSRSSVLPADDGPVNHRDAIVKDKLITFIFAAGCLSAASALPFNFGPLIFGTAADAFGFTPQHIGYFGSAYMFGFSVSSIALYFFMHRINWQLAMGLGTVAGAGIFAATAAISNPAVWIVLWFVIGLLFGQVFSLVVRAAMDLSDPTRAYGGKLALETFIPAIMLLLFPPLVVSHWGYTGLALVAALLLVLMAVTARSMPARARSIDVQPDGAHAVRNRAHQLLAWLGIITIAIYFGGQLSVWIFAERAADSLGYSLESIGLLLFLGKCGAGFGGVIAAVVGERFGRWKPHLFSILVMTLGQVLLITHVNYWAFTSGAFLFEIAWAYIVSYQVAVIAYLDETKRMTVFAPAAMALGGSYGPAVAGHLVDENNYENVFRMGLFTAFICFIVFSLLVYVIIRDQRGSAAGMQPG